jgi:hypothetical protein
MHDAKNEIKIGIERELENNWYRWIDNEWYTAQCTEAGRMERDGSAERKQKWTVKIINKQDKNEQEIRRKKETHCSFPLNDHPTLIIVLDPPAVRIHQHHLHSRPTRTQEPVLAAATDAMMRMPTEMKRKEYGRRAVESG